MAIAFLPVSANIMPEGADGPGRDGTLTQRSAYSLDLERESAFEGMDWKGEKRPRRWAAGTLQAGRCAKLGTTTAEC